MTQSQLRVAVLGSGYMGRPYAEGLSKYNTRAKLAAISGGKRAPKLASDYNVPYAPTYDELLHSSEVDAVLIATPHADHYSQVLQAAEHGKHVLLEKPMAMSVAECDAMIDACKRANVYLEIIQTLRFRGTFYRAKKLIDEGAIGSVRMIRGQSLFTEYSNDFSSWITDPKHGGAMLDMGVHNFDIIMHFAGSDPRRVFDTILSFGDHPLRNLTAITQLVMANGVIAQHWMSFELPPPSLPDSLHRYVIVGDKGILDIDGFGKLMLGRGDKWETVWVQPTIDYVNKPLEKVRLEAFFTQVQTFIDDVLDGRPPTVPGSEGRIAVEMVEASKLSSETGKAVDIPART